MTAQPPLPKLGRVETIDGDYYSMEEVHYKELAIADRLEEERIAFVKSLPVGEINAFDVILACKKHVKKMDELIAELRGGGKMEKNDSEIHFDENGILRLKKDKKVQP